MFREDESLAPLVFEEVAHISKLSPVYCTNLLSLDSFSVNSGMFREKSLAHKLASSTKIFIVVTLICQTTRKMARHDMQGKRQIQV